MSGSGRLAPDAIETRAQRLNRYGFAFGPRFFVLLGVGLLALGPALFEPRLAYVVGAWDAVLMAVWLVDLYRLPAADRFTVRRTWTAPAALAVPSRVQLTIINSSAVTVRASVVDHIPRELRAEPPTAVVEIAAAAQATSEYEIRPEKRGEATVGDVYLRYRTAFRIAERWAVARMQQSVMTYPNLTEAKREALSLTRSRPHDMERRAQRLHGSGRAFESLRDHRDGDELRDVCWTASARRGKLIVRQYEIERSQSVWILIDTGRLMRTQVADTTKLDRAVNAALTLSQVAMTTGDRVGVLAYGRKIHHLLPADRGSLHLRRIISDLAVIRGEASEADHLGASSWMLGNQKRRSLIVWITDVPDTATTPEVIRAAAQLMQRHLVLVVIINQPDLVATAIRKPRSAQEMYQSAAAQEVIHRRDVLLARLRGQGALALEADSKVSPALANAYLAVKQRNQL
jgi:uncharacterized protein (DUF58 family)